tara:strand:+ start:1764 stop:1913 length:150 start_codon:yes stop_codon:yes gene_type:complete
MGHHCPYYLFVEVRLAHDFVALHLDLRVAEVALPVERVVGAFVALFPAS